jgi:hypothetical protein
MRMRWIGLLFGLAALTLAGGARADYYGATAAGIDGSAVGVGYGLDYTTQAAADEAALTECSKRVRNCAISGRFWNGGCGYITAATTEQQGTCWGAGKSPEIALQECQARGCACQTPVGGCTRRP